MLSDHTKLSEVIVSAIQKFEGTDTTTVVDSWKDSGTRDVVAHALGSMTTKKPNGGNVVRF